MLRNLCSGTCRRNQIYDHCNKFSSRSIIFIERKFRYFDIDICLVLLTSTEIFRTNCMFNFQNILRANYEECVNIRSCHGSLLTLDVHNSVGYVRIDGIKPVVHVFMGVTNGIPMGPFHNIKIPSMCATDRVPCYRRHLCMNFCLAWLFENPFGAVWAHSRQRYNSAFETLSAHTVFRNILSLH